MIMKHLNYILTMALATIVVSSCAIRLDKKKVMESIDFADKYMLSASSVYVDKDSTFVSFRTLNFNGGDAIDCYRLVQSDSFKIRIHAPENIIPLIAVELSDDGQLNIYRKKTDFASIKNISSDIVVTVFAPSLDSIAIAGSTDLECDAYKSPNALTISMSGSGDAEFGQLSVSSFSATMIGSAEMDIKFLKADIADISISGSGNAKVSNMDVRNFKSMIAGSGDVKLEGGRAESADYNIAGSGSVDASELICGNTIYSIAGSGEVKYINSKGHVMKANRKGEEK